MEVSRPMSWLTPDIMSELQNLSLLGSSVRRNLEARPIDVSSGSDFSPGYPRISVAELTAINPSNLLIVDTRPLEAYLERHLANSAHLSIPSLIYKRISSSKAKWSGGWDALEPFVSTEGGRRVWDRRRTEVVVIGDDPDVMVELMQTRHGGHVRVLAGGWQAVEATPGLTLCTGEDSIPTQPFPRSAPIRGPLHHLSMPSLQVPDGRDTARKQLPKLDTRRVPKLSLNLTKETKEPVTAPLRSASMGTAFPDRKRSGLTLDLTHSRHPGAGPSTAALPSRSPHPLSTKPSLQNLCRQQSKLPPSPSSFGDVEISYDVPPTPSSPRHTARPPYTAAPPTSHWQGPEENEGDVTNGRSGGTPFIVSSILPSFLYLGPEITSERDIQELADMGIKRILNAAIECDEDEALGLRNRFDKYLRLPMRDNVEEKNIAKGVRDACDFIGE
jgi:hypothetical protein